MAAQQQPDDTSNLRYLEARHVRCPAGTLDNLRVCTEDDEHLGAIDGVLLDPVRRRLCYFVVKSPAMLLKRRYLVPADAPAIFEPESKLLRLEAQSNELEREAFEAAAVQPFSDEDVITAMFSRSAA
jgi:hypothetical protein